MEKIETHIGNRIKEVWEICKVFMDNLQTSVTEIREKSIQIKKKAGENSALTAEDFREDLVFIQVAHKDRILKEMEYMRYQAILSDLQTTAKLFDITANIPQEEREAFETFSKGTPNTFVAVRGKLEVFRVDESAAIRKQFEETSSAPEKIQHVFHEITNTPHQQQG